MATIIVQNIATEYKDEGSGKILLLLHGWKDSLHSFDAILPFLSDHYRIIRLDLPGFGKTELPDKPWTISDYIAFVGSFMHKLSINADVLIGHSFGGRIILKGVGTGILQSEKILLIGSAGITRRRTVRNTILTICSKIAKVVFLLPFISSWKNKIRKKTYEKLGSDYFESEYLKKTFLKVIQEDLSSYAKNIHFSTLLIWGENDTETPLSDGILLSRIISPSKLEIIREAGHHVHQTHPKAIAHLIKNFVC